MYQIIKTIFFLLSLVSICFAANTNNPKQVMPDIRLYTLNCGYIDVHDGYNFSDSGYYPHKPLNLADPCFLIKHPKGWLIWDVGLNNKYLKNKSDDPKYGVTLNLPISIESQLKELGLTPRDITYVGLSHTHFDHMGNIDLFKNSTVLIQKAEYQPIAQRHLVAAQDNALLNVLRSDKVKKILLNGDYDVFKDGSVIILSTPGHTIGHQSLEIKLPHTGTVILSGDLYHTQMAYKNKLVPSFNYSRSETLDSISRVESISASTHAQLIVQHDLDNFNSLPKFPGYLN